MDNFLVLKQSVQRSFKNQWTIIDWSSIDKMKFETMVKLQKMADFKYLFQDLNFIFKWCRQLSIRSNSTQELCLTFLNWCETICEDRFLVPTNCWKLVYHDVDAIGLLFFNLGWSLLQWNEFSHHLTGTNDFIGLHNLLYKRRVPNKYRSRWRPRHQTLLRSAAGQ